MTRDDEHDASTSSRLDRATTQLAAERNFDTLWTGFY